VVSPRPLSIARRRAGTPSAISQVRSPVLPGQTRLPVGGGAVAGGGGAGSVAPSVAADFDVLVVAVATILLARWFLERAMWRSTLLASRLERPG